jgi:hypothetical protein
MALVVRILVVIFGFIVASFAAAMVITISIVISEWGNMMSMSPYGAWVTVGFFGFMFSGLGLLPAFLVILVAESLGIRSIFFYTVLAGIGFAALYYALGEQGGAGEMAPGRGLEIMAAAGIAGGFVYWAIAGRNAGLWRKPSEQRPNQDTPPIPPPG